MRACVYPGLTIHRALCRALHRCSLSFHSNHGLLVILDPFYRRGNEGVLVFSFPKGQQLAQDYTVKQWHGLHLKPGSLLPQSLTSKHTTSYPCAKLSSLRNQAPLLLSSSETRKPSRAHAQLKFCHGRKNTGPRAKHESQLHSRVGVLLSGSP